MQIHNAAVTGSFTYNGIDISDITGSEQSVVALNEFSASILNYTSSNNEKIAALNAATASLYAASSSLYNFSASILSYTSSTDAKIAQLNRETSSLNFATASINNATASLYNATASINSFSASILNYTSSNNNNIAALYAATASLYAATASIYGATSSLFNYSASSNLRIGSLEQYTASLNTRSASFACINATNNFACTQYFSNTSNAVSFTSTGSLYSDGGVRITRDMYVSGTAFFNNVTVFGTQSINYISSSQLNIASNIISVNTATPTVRFGGLAVYDSGSLGTGLTGSILWDSEDNQWIYSNPSGSTYDSALFLVGPRNAGVLGNEPGISCNFLSKGNGMHHMTSSGIFEDGSRTCFYNNASITSAGAACFGGATIIAGCVGIGYATPTVQLQVSGTIATGDSTNGWGRLSFNTNEVRLQASKDGIDPINISFWTQASGGAFAERMRIACDGKVGIGTTSPSAELQVNKNCDAVIAISNCINVTSGNRGSIAFYNCATSTVGLIRAAAVTDNVGTELQFHTRPAGGSLTQVLTLGNTGIASFACQVCASSLSICGNAVLSRASTSAGANVEFRTAGTLNWYLGTRGLVNNNFYIVNEGLSGLSNVIIDATTGATTFACITCAPIVSATTRVLINSTCPCSMLMGVGGYGTTWGGNSCFYGGGISGGGFPYGDEYGNGASYTYQTANTAQTNPSLLGGFSGGYFRGGNGGGYGGGGAGIVAIGGNGGNAESVNSGGGAGIFARGGLNGACSALAYAAWFDGGDVVMRCGKMGVNCTAPFMPLTVAGCASIDKLVINGTCFNSFGEHLQINGCARLFYGQFRVSSGPNDSNYMFLTHDDVNGYLCINRTIYAGNMILAPFGGVGINTSVVSSKLTVNSGINTSSANVLTLQQATNGANKDAAAFGLSIQNGGESTNAADLYISTASGGSLGERMRIMSTAPFVYITGTAGNISADTGNGNLLELYGSNITGACCGVGIGFTRAGSQLGYIKAARENASDEASYMIFATQTSAGTHPERMRITSGGTVGINNSSPDTNSRLDVNGQAFVAQLAVYNNNGTPSLGTSPILYSPASATLGISMGTAERVRISTSGTCFSCLVYAPSFCQPSGFTVYSFNINYGSNFVDVTSGNYLSIGGTEPGTINSYCAYAHGGISPRAVAANTEGMSWTCLRFVLRVLSPVGDAAGTATYLQTAGYFYSTGWYGLGTCTNIAGVMDGSRGYSTVVLPWIPYSSFQNAGDVTGFGIRNVGPTTTRIGTVWIQYK